MIGLSSPPLDPGGGETLSMIVTGPHLDPNYTLVANPRSGRVFEVHAAGRHLRVSVAIPNDQPKGMYAGAIVDKEQRVARGTLTVTVG